MTDEQKAALVDALKTLPACHSFTAGYGIKAEDDDAQTPDPMPGVLIRWPDTKEGREAAGLFGTALWG